MTQERTKETVDLWVAGTEEPQFQPTDEGMQEFLPEESADRLADQYGRVVDDDYVFDDEVPETTSAWSSTWGLSILRPTVSSGSNSNSKAK